MKIRTRNSVAAISLEATGSSQANKAELLLYDGNISATCSNAEISIPKEALNPYVKISIDRDDAFDTSPQIAVYKNTLEISDSIIPIGSKSVSTTGTRYA